MITDVHTHAFPDKLAARAMQILLEECDKVTAYRDGTVGSLLESMQQAGIERSVICSIATRPEQWRPILDWSLTIRSNRILPLGSVHPQDEFAVKHLQNVADAGLPGIKLHPYYQDFVLDDPAYSSFFSAMEDLGLELISHCGYDVAFPEDDRAAPFRIINLLKKHPRLKMVTTHLGAWNDWQSVREHLLGRPVWMEVSYSLELLPADEAREMLLSHPPEYLLFGTDSPWQDQSAALKLLRSLELPQEIESAMLHSNPLRLFP